MDVPHPFPDALLGQVAHRLTVLGQPVRIRIVELLRRESEISVQALADELGATQQNVSRHLALLYHHGIVERRQEGRQVWYSLADEDAFALLEDAEHHVLKRFRRMDPIAEDRPNGDASALTS